MKKIEILVICTHPEILATIIRLINGDLNLKATSSSTVHEAISLLKSGIFDLVMLGSGLTETEEQEVINKLREISPETPVIEHYGGGSGLLFTEIKRALPK